MTVASDVQSVLEGWFGEAIEHMDDEKRVRKFLLEPLIKAATSCGAESNRHSGAVGAEKRAEQSNPGGGHEVTESNSQHENREKPLPDEPTPAAGGLMHDAAQTAVKRQQIQFDVEAYVEGYDFRGEVDYTPTPAERELLIDAIHGVIHEINESFPHLPGCQSGDFGPCDCASQPPAAPVEAETNTAASPLEVSASPAATEGLVSCRDQNSPGYAAGNAAQLGCEGNRLPRRSDRDEGPWAAVGVTAGRDRQALQSLSAGNDDAVEELAEFLCDEYEGEIGSFCNFNSGIKNRWRGLVRAMFARVPDEPQSAPLPVEAIRAAITLLARKITKLSWSRDECRRKGQDAYVANITAQMDTLDGYHRDLTALAMTRPLLSRDEKNGDQK